MQTLRQFLSLLVLIILIGCQENKVKTDPASSIAHDEPDRCVLIDAEGTPDQVAARVWAAVAARLPEVA